jgi:hypothetical protein
MLKASNRSAKFCYLKALEAEQQADNARMLSDREFWLNIQKRWLGLAVNADFCERLAAFVANLQQRHRQPVCLACDVPMRIGQLRCSSHRTTEYHYECPACAAKQTVVERDTDPRSPLIAIASPLSVVPIRRAKASAGIK